MTTSTPMLSLCITTRNRASTLDLTALARIDYQSGYDVRERRRAAGGCRFRRW